MGNGREMMTGGGRAGDAPPAASCHPPSQDAPPLRPGERLDALGRDGLRIIQHPALFRFTTDAYLLAAFSRVRRGESVLELGSGGGVVVLLLAARTEASRVVGVEIQPALAGMAGRSIALNGLAERAVVLRHDLRTPLATASRFDLVVANPPYLSPGTGRPGPNDAVNSAKQEILCTLRDVAEAAARAVAGNGRFILIHRPGRLPEILDECRRVHLIPKRLAMVHPRPGRAAARLLLEARPGGRPGLAVDPPLCIRGDQGGFTPEMEEVYAGRWPWG